MVGGVLRRATVRRFLKIRDFLDRYLRMSEFLVVDPFVLTHKNDYDRSLSSTSGIHRTSMLAKRFRIWRKVAIVAKFHVH